MSQKSSNFKVSNKKMLSPMLNAKPCVDEWIVGFN